MMKWAFISVVVLILVVGIWLAVGFFLPQRLYPAISDAAAFGDSFGCVNSLFASLAFAFIAIALILQIKETRDNALTQAEQGRVVLEQTQIAERTTRIQEAMRLDAHRRLAMDAFLAINRDTMAFRHAFLALHPENNIPVHSDIIDRETERRLKKEYFDAYTALRSNCLRTGLIFGKQGDLLGNAVQNLYIAVHEWTRRTPPPAAECQDEIDQQIELIERAMELLWQSVKPPSYE